MTILSKEELKKIGFKSIGENCLISSKASFYGADRISIGNNVRIDDFCVLSAGAGGIEIGNFIHIAVYTSLIGGGRIIIADFSGLSSRTTIYSSNDDYSGNNMTNPSIPTEFTNVTHADVIIKKHAIIGSGSVILPGVTIEEGAAVGALSLVNRDCEEFFIYAGNPAKKIKPRSRSLLDKEKKFMQTIQ